MRDATRFEIQFEWYRSEVESLTSFISFARNNIKDQQLPRYKKYKETNPPLAELIHKNITLLAEVAEQDLARLKKIQNDWANGIDTFGRPIQRS
jgi:hypothetical protein